jgi:hypothetical protein
MIRSGSRLALINSPPSASPGVDSMQHRESCIGQSDREVRRSAHKGLAAGRSDDTALLARNDALIMTGSGESCPDLRYCTPERSLDKVHLRWKR